jgi:nicotine blue oxidoreductase
VTEPSAGSPGGVGGVLLAAGEGRRIGRPKALLEVGGELLVARAVRVLHEGGCEAVVAVVGATGPLAVTGADVVVNDDWRQGMGSSLRLGLARCGSSAAVLMLVDTPGVGPEVVRRLIEAYRAGAPVVAATYAGVARTPVLMAREHWAAAGRQAVGDVGARAFLTAHRDLVTEVECGDVADPADIDTPADLARWQ